MSMLQFIMLNGKIIDDEYGNVCYYKDDKLHREDGPAVECYNGRKFWYLNGKCYTEKNYWIKLQELQLGIFKPFFTEEEFKV